MLRYACRLQFDAALQHDVAPGGPHSLHILMPTHKVLRPTTGLSLGGTGRDPDTPIPGCCVNSSTVPPKFKCPALAVVSRPTAQDRAPGAERHWVGPDRCPSPGPAAHRRPYLALHLPLVADGMVRCVRHMPNSVSYMYDPKAKHTFSDLGVGSEDASLHASHIQALKGMRPGPIDPGLVTLLCYTHAGAVLTRLVSLSSPLGSLSSRLKPGIMISRFSRV
ncbi:hypothetical protein LIA77_04509 [Sarocladium implicatum]|nr:hypothetical protein LIA77_04509 [Sarocladium implicatum]